MAGDRFAGKVVWVTGASSGIGRALALAWHRAGAKLILSARSAASLEPVRQACADRAEVRVIPFDLAALDSIPEVAAQALAVWGRIDYMVHNAGVALRERMLGTPLDLDQRIITVNYFGPWALTRALLPSMQARRSGCFVVVSSLSGKYGVPKLSAYAAAKHALHGGFESLRAEVHHLGIRITMIVPGFVRTPILEHALTGSGAKYGKSLPSYQRGMDPDVCAARVLRAVSESREEALIGGWELSSVHLQRLFPKLMSVLVRNRPVQLGNRMLRMVTLGIAGRNEEI